MLRTGIGEDSCRIGCPRGKRADYTRYRHRCRWRCGRPGVGGSGYAGMNNGFRPRFLRRYADLHTVMTDAISRYVSDVKNLDFPNEKEQY